MKGIIYSTLFTLISLTAHGQNTTVSKLSKEIIGRWQLLSSKKGGENIDYTKRDVHWSFDGKYLAVMSDDLNGQIKGRYYFRRSVFRIEPTYILKCTELTKTHLPYGKLVVKSIHENELTLIDWDNTISYSLKRIKEE